jgi:hypothetical protein
VGETGVAPAVVVRENEDDVWLGFAEGRGEEACGGNQERNDDFHAQGLGGRVWWK